MSSIAFVGALLILPEGPRPLTLRIQGDTIISIGGTPYPADTIVDLTGYIIFPGLINALDRLDDSSSTPFKMRTQYETTREWQQDLAEQSNSEEMTFARQSPVGDRLFIGGLANLLNGVTSVLHTGSAPGPFSSVRRLGLNIIDCWNYSPPTYMNANFRTSFNEADPSCPWIIPVAESTDGSGSQEFRQLEEAQCLASNTVLVSALDIHTEDIRSIAKAGASIVWTPGANLHILGRTHVHSLLTNSTVLGTDSRVKGSRGLLHELKLAQDHSSLPSMQLVKMVTDQAARVLRLVDGSGLLTQGASADLLIIKNQNEDPYSLLVGSERAAIDLVMSRGKPIIGARSTKKVFDVYQQNCVEVTLDGRPSLIARDIWRRYSRIRLNIRGLLSA